jgi:hypothetical protein
VSYDFLSGLILAVLSLAALWLVVRVFRLYRTALSSRHWPVAQGRIIALEMDVRQLVREKLYVPRVTYCYRVSGTDYQGRRIDLTSQRKFYSQSAANAVLEDYRSDGVVAVYYNPARPADSLLKPGVTTATWMITGLVAMLLILFVSIGVRS